MAITMDGIFVNGQKATFHPEDILSGDASAYTQEIGTAVEEWMEENVTGGEQVTDTTLTLPGVPADAKMTGDKIDELKEELSEIEPGLSEEAKTALLNCFQHVAWATVDGQALYDTLHYALYPATGLVRIAAVFNQGSLVVTPKTPLDTLKAYLTVTGYYDDGTTKKVTDYTLSGELNLGTSTITVMREGITTTFSVTVAWLPQGYTKCDYIITGSLVKNDNEFATKYHPNNLTRGVARAKLRVSHAEGTNYIASMMTCHSASGYSVGISYSTKALQHRWQTYRGGQRYDSDLLSEFDTNVVRDFVFWPEDALLIDNNAAIENVLDAGATTENPMYVFGDSHDASELYALTIYENDAIVADYIPCYRESDGTVGLYDIIGKEFFGNAKLIAGQSS